MHMPVASEPIIVCREGRHLVVTLTWQARFLPLETCPRLRLGVDTLRWAHGAVGQLYGLHGGEPDATGDPGLMRDLIAAARARVIARDLPCVILACDPRERRRYELLGFHLMDWNLLRPLPPRGEPEDRPPVDLWDLAGYAPVIGMWQVMP